LGARLLQFSQRGVSLFFCSVYPLVFSRCSVKCSCGHAFIRSSTNSRSFGCVTLLFPPFSRQFFPSCPARMPVPLALLFPGTSCQCVAGSLFLPFFFFLFPPVLQVTCDSYLGQAGVVFLLFLFVLAVISVHRFFALPSRVLSSAPYRLVLLGSFPFCAILCHVHTGTLGFFEVAGPARSARHSPCGFPASARMLPLFFVFTLHAAISPMLTFRGVRRSSIWSFSRGAPASFGRP